ncbi:hypothetical protein PR048_031981 [Dryococelus australis]|uniref:PiggyBac transposable element-derived protein domain-containing protein n=1 Tax=Dryococelus australis TaxID=614101 RepID=A0ABQ9G7T0_9NEOP|nr:hypothetical protein PR048_031981 [Dryococelus australis]
MCLKPLTACWTSEYTCVFEYSCCRNTSINQHKIEALVALAISDENTPPAPVSETLNFDRIFGLACFEDTPNEENYFNTSVQSTKILCNTCSSAQLDLQNSSPQNPKYSALPQKKLEVNPKWKKIEKGTVITPFDDPIGVLLLLPSWKDYWNSARDLNVGSVLEDMSRDRFEAVLLTFHVNDNTLLPHGNKDKLCKHRPIIDTLNKVFPVVYKGTWKVERGRGINYKGEAEFEHFGLGERVVLQLTKQFWGQQRIVYFDNFSSLPLLEMLQVRGVPACGTIRVSILEFRHSVVQGLVSQKAFATSRKRSHKEARTKEESKVIL